MDLALLIVRGVGESTAATGCNEVQLRFGRVGLVSAVVVQIPGQNSAHFSVLARQLADHAQRLVLVLEPVGRMQDDDDLVARFDLLSDGLEVVPLRDVEAVAQGDVNAPDPPIMRKLEREIAALLLAPPAADSGGLVAELIGEGRKAVIPVVVAGDEEQLPPWLRIFCVRREGKSPVVRIEATRAVFLLGGIRVRQVAAEYEDLAGRQF